MATEQQAVYGENAGGAEQLKLPAGIAAPAGERRATIFSEGLPFAQLQAWAVRGGASIFQQGLFAGSHFLANVLLARWLAPESYGAFALAYSFSLLLLSLYMALFYEPLLVFGPGRYKNSFSGYVQTLVRGHFLFLLPISLLIVSISPVLGGHYTHEFQTAFASLAAVCPFLLLIWLFRGVFYAQLNPYAGTTAGACYFVLLLASVSLLWVFGILSPATALGAMGAASLIVSVGCLYGMHLGGPRTGINWRVMTRSVLLDHWSYGRWAILAAIATWIPANIYYAVLPSHFGLQATAVLRAMMNLMHPLLHSFTALLTLLIPILVRQREQKGLERSKRTTLQLIAMFIPLGILYLLFVTAFRAPILGLLYGGRYGDVSLWVVLCVSALPTTTGVVGLLGSALRSFERPHLAFYGYLSAMLMALFVGIPLTVRYGVPGAASALVLNDLPAIAVLAICFARHKDSGGVVG